MKSATATQNSVCSAAVTPALDKFNNMASGTAIEGLAHAFCSAETSAPTARAALSFLSATVADLQIA